MSFSIELHCDAGDDCENNRENPVVMVWAKEGIASATRELQAAALKGGWKRVHSGWACPICASPKSKSTARKPYQKPR
jgi:hypothetical protein